MTTFEDSKKKPKKRGIINVITLSLRLKKADIVVD
jgi:hypothetical protein